MHNLLAKAGEIGRPRIVPGSMAREHGKHTAIPRAYLFYSGSGLLIYKVETVTNRAEVRACATAEALARDCFPNLILE